MPKKLAQEWQFDGLVGPTHNYAGLSFGNVASEKNAGAISNPKEAALQGLQKMQFVKGLGVPQAFLPPQKRPIVSQLQQLGFGSGNSPDAYALMLEKTYKSAPHILAAAFSSSFMWAANAATVSPSADTTDGKLHLTPANLISNYHRSMEAGATYRLLKSIFHNETLFDVHNPLPSAAKFSDEGAANHMRACAKHGDKGVEIFVYGVNEYSLKKPKKFPGRQNEAASAAIARSHGLSSDHILLVQQDPDAIDSGVFHNDVIAMNTTRLMIAHERAFLDKKKFINDLQRHQIEDFSYLEIAEDELSVEEAVKSYLFNSQLLYIPDSGFVILAPVECETSENAHKVLRGLEEGNKVVSTVHFLNVRESMRNGGGPACLRLRVVMTDEESTAMHQGIVITESRYAALVQWVNRYYRDRLSLSDLRDPAFIVELNEAYAALETIIEMPGLYPELA